MTKEDVQLLTDVGNPEVARRFYSLGNNLDLSQTVDSFVFRTPTDLWVVFHVLNQRGDSHLLWLAPGRVTAEERGPFTDLRDLTVAPTRLYFRQEYNREPAYA